MRYFLIISLLIISHLALGQSNKARHHISVLTSDSLAGRGYTRDGQEKAADYIINQLNYFGISAANNNEFKQKVEYSVNTFPGTTQFSVHDKKNVKIYAAGKDYLYHSASADIDIKGKINKISTIELERLKGSNQIFYLTKGSSNAKFVDENIRKFLFESKSKNNLLIVHDSTKWSWFPSRQQSNNAVLFIKNELELNSKVSAQTGAVFKPNFTSSNIIAKIEGEKSDSCYMFSAHYDHLGEMGNAIFKGANDNASGTAMLLTLAEYFSLNKPKYDIYFLFTTAEEMGLLGSYHFIENSPFDLRQIKMLINLDIVGTGEDGITVVNAKKQDSFYSKLLKLNDGRIPAIKSRGEACNSDHCLFDQMGVPSVFIYTLGGKQAYHDIYDNGEDLSLEAYDELQKLLIETIQEY